MSKFPFLYRLFFTALFIFPLLILTGIAVFILAIPIALKILVDEGSFKRFREDLGVIFESDEQERTRKLKECPYKHTQSDYFYLDSAGNGRIKDEYKDAYCLKPNGDCTFPDEDHDNHPKG